MLKRPVINRVRLCLGALTALAALLLLQLVMLPLPVTGDAISTDAHAQSVTDAPQDVSMDGRPVWHRAAIGLSIVLLAGSAGAWWLIEKRVFTPLDDMTGVVAAMAEGRLDQTLDAAGGTELARLAELINTFSANQQEGLLFVWNQAGSSLESLGHLEQHASRIQCSDTGSTTGEGPTQKAMANLLEEARHTRSYLEGIQSLVRTYYLYDVCLDDQKALAAVDAA